VCYSFVLLLCFLCVRAVSSVQSFTDRTCIFSNGTDTPYLSVSDTLSCCGLNCGNCEGGQPDQAWKYFVNTGVVTGGGYNGGGCYSYQIPPCQHSSGGTRPACSAETTAPYCPKKCTTNEFDWGNDKNYGSSYYQVKAAGKLTTVQAIQAELYKNGPLQATFYVYSDFMYYKSGVYSKVSGQQLGGHAVRLLGWGVENSEATGFAAVPYWLMANSVSHSITCIDAIIMK